MHSYENDQQKLNYLSDLFPRPKNTLVSFASLYINTFLATVVAICIQYMNNLATIVLGFFSSTVSQRDCTVFYLEIISSVKLTNWFRNAWRCPITSNSQRRCDKKIPNRGEVFQSRREKCWQKVVCVSLNASDFHQPRLWKSWPRVMLWSLNQNFL